MLSYFTNLAATNRSLLEGLKAMQGSFISYIKEKNPGLDGDSIMSSGTQAPCFLSCHPKSIVFSLKFASWSQDGG